MGSPSLRALPAGARVAVAVGSRGIDRLPLLVRGCITALRGMGLRPFIVPAMGSHGGADAEGQRMLLRHLGVTEESTGAPVVSSPGDGGPGLRGSRRGLPHLPRRL